LVRPHVHRGSLAASLFSVLALAFFTGAPASAGDGVTAKLLTSPAAAPSVMADFDGDHKPDLATLGMPDQIQVQLGTAQFPIFTLLIHPSANRLSARDLDGDHDRDLVLESPFNVPLGVWINDGAGNFHVGDLETFRFQLSHDDPRTLCSFARLLAPIRTAEGPRRSISLASPFYPRPVPAGPKLLVRDLDYFATNLQFDLWTRGPPVLS
jgi:hypothetical protein